MVRSEGFRFGKLRRRAEVQSTNSVESCFDQNCRSSSSDLNAGTVLRLVFTAIFPINFPLLPIHIPHRDNANEVPTDREGREQQPAATRLP
jgi:hypothetical protein